MKQVIPILAGTFVLYVNRLIKHLIQLPTAKNNLCREPEKENLSVGFQG